MEGKEEEGSSSKVDVLTTTTWSTWAPDMEAFLFSKGLGDFLSRTTCEIIESLNVDENDKLTKKQEYDIRISHDKALGHLRCLIDSNCKEIIRSSTSVKEAWRTLQEQLEGKETYNKIYLLTLAFASNLPEGNLDVDTYVKQKERIFRRLQDVGLMLPDELIVLMILMGLPQAFDTQRRIIEARPELKLEDVKRDLRQEALRLRAQEAHAQMLGMQGMFGTSPMPGHSIVHLSQSQTRKRERKWCPHCKSNVYHDPPECWELPQNAAKRKRRGRPSTGANDSAHTKASPDEDVYQSAGTK
jgi:gag-polypeptide of LTR copia-type